MKSADKNCEQVKQRQYVWSPTLTKARNVVSYWKLRKAMAAGEIQTDNIIWRRSKYKSKDNSSANVQCVNKTLKEAWRELYNTQKGKHTMQNISGGPCSVQSRKIGTKEEQEIKKLLHIEEMRKTAKKYG